MKRKRQAPFYSRFAKLFIRNEEEYPHALSGKLPPWVATSKVTKQRLITVNTAKSVWIPRSGQANVPMITRPSVGWIRFSHPEKQKLLKQERLALKVSQKPVLAKRNAKPLTKSVTRSVTKSLGQPEAGVLISIAGAGESKSKFRSYPATA